jgi:hypothetical protein
MVHDSAITPEHARTPGGADYAVAVDEAVPPLPPVGDVAVVVIDTGLVVDADHQPHPWFGNHVSIGPEDEDPLEQGRGADDEPGYLAPADGHGTFVTGLILREAPTARVIMCGILDKADLGADGRLGNNVDVAVADAVRSLGDRRDIDDIKVINLSFGGGEFRAEGDARSLGEALRELNERQPGIAVVASAGNGAGKDPVWPAALPGVISVGALDEQRVIPVGAIPPRATFSNHGHWVNAYASGVQVLGPFVDFEETGTDVKRPRQHFRGWARWSGTSFSAATVSGRIARMAIDRRATGKDAAEAVLGSAPIINSHGAVWVRATT